MQLNEEFKNMENNIAKFKFKKENKELELELDTPNFSNFVRELITNNYEVTSENIEILLEGNENNEIDINELKNIIIEIHGQYSDEILKFYENTKNEINTYYSDDTKIIEELHTYIEELMTSTQN